MTKLLCLNDIQSHMRDNECVYVYDFEKLIANCRSVTSLFPKAVAHHYDLSTEPNLSVASVVCKTLRGRINIPNPYFKDYLLWGGLSLNECLYVDHDVMRIETVDQFTSLNLESYETDSIAMLDKTFLALGTAEKFWDGMIQRNVRLFIYAENCQMNDEVKIASVVGSLPGDVVPLIHIIHGRALFGDVASLWLRVRAIKHTKGRKFAVLSGGINLLWNASFSNNALRKKYTVTLPFRNSQNGPTEKMTFCGPLCTPQDTIVVDQDVNGVDIGDTVMIPNIASEGYHQSPYYFISHPRPRVLAYYDQQLHVIQEGVCTSSLLLAANMGR